MELLFAIADLVFTRDNTPFILTLVFSAVGGIVLPFSENILGQRTGQWIAVVLSHFEYTGLLSSKPIMALYKNTPINMFAFFGRWHVLMLVPPMANHIRGGETDDAFFASLAMRESQLFLYFGPTVAACVLKYLWSIRIIVIMVSACLVGAWSLLPSPWRNLMLCKMVILAVEWHRKHDISFRGLTMQAYEVLIGPFDRFEIAVAQWRRNRSYPWPQPYEYNRFKAPEKIRLLRLKRRTLFSEPVCELVTVSLKEAPPFEAISHTWGKEDPSIPIKVHGHGCIMVRSAVDELLFYQRSIFRLKLLWIDSVCIDQSNIDERDRQVLLMTEIYRRASRVIVWLGPPKSVRETSITRTMIKTLNWPKSSYFGKVDVIETRFKTEKTGYLALGELFCHPWYERMWVVQEIAVPQTVHVMYKGICVDWDRLATAAREMNSDPDLHYRFVHYWTTASAAEIGRNWSIDTITDLRWSNVEYMATIREAVQSGNPLPLHLLMILTTGFESGDARDRIFALLGIASDRDRLSFHPSYQDSIELVFLKTATFLLSSEYWFTLLSLTGRGYEPLRNGTRSKLVNSLPSWVPDYSSDAMLGAQINLHGLGSRDVTGKVTFTNNPRIIQLQAIDFDKIQHIRPSSRPLDAFVEEQVGQSLLIERGKKLIDWYVGARQLARECSTCLQESQETADQNFWELCMGGGESSDSTGPPPLRYPYSSLAARKLFERLLSTDSKERIEEFIQAESLTSEEALKTVWALLKKFGEMTVGKAFCITSAGSMGLVPPLARKMDTLVYVKGGNMPMVFRRKRLGEYRAELVGSCRLLHVEDMHSFGIWECWLLE